MSVSVALYQNNSENYRLDKSLTAKYAESCTLKDGCSIESPVLLITNANNLSDCNYLYISDFGRYYFIEDIISIRDGLWEIHAHVDVLMTYSTQIKACTATFKRQEHLFNMYLDDPEFRTYNKSQVVTKRFSGGHFNKTSSYVLVVAGGGSQS